MTVVVGVSVRSAGHRDELVVERPTTVEAVVAGINSLVYLCPPDLRPTALAEVARLTAADPGLISAPVGAGRG